MSDLIPIEGYQPTQGPDPADPPTGGSAIPASPLCAVCGAYYALPGSANCRFHGGQTGPHHTFEGYQFAADGLDPDDKPRGVSGLVSALMQFASEWIELGDGGVVLRNRVSAVTPINASADPRLQPYREEGYLSYVYLIDSDMQVPSKRKAEDLAAELMGNSLPDIPA